MNRKNLYCTIDTETVGGATNPTGTYNYGGIIHNKTGHVYASFSILVMEHYDEIEKDGYAKKTFPLYRERLEAGLITAVTTEDEAVALIRNLCRNYGVKYLTAYNSGFDFCKTKCKELLNEFEFIDIYLMALQTVTHLKKYQIFCMDNYKFSSSQRCCSTTAETVYAFFTNSPKYKEEHTAVSDALIEMEIFIRCASMKKKYTKNCHAWDCKDGSKYYPPRIRGYSRET